MKIKFPLICWLAPFFRERNRSHSFDFRVWPGCVANRESRTLSQATAFDALLALILGSILARGIIGSVPLLTISSARLVGLHWLLSLAAAESH